MFGPKDTVYEGGTFIVDIEIPGDYPFKPPKMKFLTKLWHPNVSSQTGAICLDILKNEWTPALTIRTALISLQALMCCPEPDSPQDAVVAEQYKKNIAAFNAQAKEWAVIHAGAPAGDKPVEVKPDPNIQTLMSLGGFEEAYCKQVYQRCNSDVNNAYNFLTNVKSLMEMSGRSYTDCDNALCQNQYNVEMAANALF